MTTIRCVLGAAVFLLAVADGFAQSRLGPAECPQPRFTGKAPEQYYELKNPVEPSAENLAAAERIFLGKTRAPNCSLCHGPKGDGKGALSSMYDPPPRNFACAQTVDGIPDGQLFWIIKFGSPGTAMPGSARLPDEGIWQLVLYLRSLARGSAPR